MTDFLKPHLRAPFASGIEGRRTPPMPRAAVAVVLILLALALA